MRSRFNRLTFYSVVLLVHFFNKPISTRSCYECAVTFPASEICLPSCSSTFRSNSTCLLLRNIPLVPTSPGSIRAGHISEEPVIADAQEKEFFFGEEAVYLNPSSAVGWHWEYGPITYGCDTE